MPEIATSEREIVLFYNPNTSTAQESYGYARGDGWPVREVDILKDRFTGSQLEELAERLGTDIEGLVNKDHPQYHKLFGNTNLDSDDWIKVLRKNPEFIKEPIAIRGHQAIFVKTPSDLSRL